MTQEELIKIVKQLKFNSDVLPFAVFAVNLIGGMTNKLIEKADSSLRYVVAVRYDIVYLVHMVQVFNETDIQSIRDFHIELLYGTECLQSYHLAHELDVFGGNNFFEQFAFISILSV